MILDINFNMIERFFILHLSNVYIGIKQTKYNEIKKLKISGLLICH